MCKHLNEHDCTWKIEVLDKFIYVLHHVIAIELKQVLYLGVECGLSSKKYFNKVMCIIKQGSLCSSWMGRDMTALTCKRHGCLWLMHNNWRTFTLLLPSLPSNPWTLPREQLHWCCVEMQNSLHLYCYVAQILEMDGEG